MHVAWRVNKKGWIISATFSKYFSKELPEELKVFCEKVKMADKILFLDNVPGYPLCVFLSQ
jgi:hypothetical protein